MKTIWKYALTFLSPQTFNIPAGSKFLSAQVQLEKITLWFEVHSGNPNETRTFLTYGTGHPIDNTRAEYLAPVQRLPFVWHIYEEIK